MKKNFLLTMVLALLAFFTVQTTNAQAPVATPEQAITGLLNRIGGNGAADKFAIVIDANLAENGKDVFVITSQDGKPCIKGNTQLSVATGINWYLNHYAHINLTWNNLTTDLSAVELPVPTQDEKHVCNTTYRYDFNTCTFSYSMAFWTWERWQQEIDWMALHGINAPLNLVGLEVVTRNFLREIGVTEADINDYIAGPGFMAWFAMNNLEGWGSTINSSSTGVEMNGNPDWWYTRQEQLCRNMMQRMRELGMQPVIPGFSGQVPKCLTGYTTIDGFSGGDVVTVGSWASNFPHPGVVNPSTNSYKNLADVYYKHLHDVMGISEFYSIDPFHEMSAPVAASVLYPNIMSHLDRCYALETAEERAKFNAPELPKWIIQYWQGTPVTGAFTAMKNAGYTNRFIALDLFADNIYADNAAKWRTNYYDTCPYIYCMLHNFGGRSGMHGRLQTTMDGYFEALAKNNNCQGIGATPEGTETNPVLYDMLFELPWMDVNNRPTADEWLEEYSYSRYGVKNDIALEALKNLKKSVWDCKVNQQGTSEAVILARPNWTVNSVSSWSTSAIYWDTQDVRLAADQLISIADLIKENNSADGTANYNYDVIDAIRQAMVDYAAELLPLINAARGNTAEYTRLYQLYLQLMLDLDTMLSYDEGFKLERWTSLARNIADEVAGTTENDRNWLEWNARTQVTVWANQDCALHDYSNRCWAGLIKDFHYKRWEKFFTTNGGSFDGGWYRGFEYPWTVDFNNTYNLASDYSQVVIPNDMTATEKAVETFGKYFGRVKGIEKNYIFPMGVASNATKSMAIPEVYRGQEVELPLIIGKEVTISSVWIDLNNDGNAGNGETLTANGNNVTIPADAAIGKTTAKVTYSDGTVITFSLALIEDITSARTVTAVAGANGSVAIEGSDALSVTTTEAVKITATANTGYNFENWTKDGEVVSNDNPFIYYGKEEATFTANFIQDKWGVPTEDKSDWGDAQVKTSFVNELTFAYYNREPETIYEASVAPDNLFNTIPQIINVPQGASFDVTWSDDNSNGLQFCCLSAYIDLNADGDFTDEGELLKVAGTKGAKNTAACEGKINVILPYDAPLGITHMRLRFDGAWKDNGYDAATKSYDAKAQLNRMCYEVVINVTEKSDKAATINVETNAADWGTVEVWTDETPTTETFKEYNVSANIPLYLRATKASEDVEFLGWYDQYGRLLTENLEHTMYAREDATYTARFRKFLEIDGWQIEYRTEPGSDVVTTKLAKGVKPEAGKKYYIAADAKQSDGSFVSHYLYDNGSALKTATSVNGNSYLWTCIVNDDKTYSFQNESGKYLANDGNYYLSIGATPAKYAFETANAGSGVALTNVSDGYTGSKWMVTKFDGSAFNKNSVSVNNGSWCNDYIFVEVAVPDVVVLTNVRKSGNHDLVIPETVEILGEQLKIVGFDNNLFKNNKDLWSISLPSTIETLSNNKVFTGVVKGKGANASNNSGNYITTDLGTTLAAGEDWSISLTIEDNGNNFNEWGSALISTGSAPMNSTYSKGFQLYMQSTSNGGKLIVKLDNDNNNNALASISKGTKYRIDIVYTHSNTQLVVTATSLESQASLAARRANATRATNSLTLTQDMSDFSVVSHAIPEGVNITNLEVRKGTEPDPFEGCTNLMDIEVADGCDEYYVQDRTLYTTGGTILHTLADEEKEDELRALGEIIDLTKALIAEVTTNVAPTGKATEIALNATQGNDYYIWCNNPHTSGNDGAGGVAALLDEDASTYLHSNWDANTKSTIHDYLQIDFGNAVGLDNFKIAGQQRNSGSNDRPKNIEIYGSNDNSTWTPITTVEGLPNTAGATWASDAISTDVRYSHLKFVVKTHDNYNQTSSVSRPYFHMAKFDLFNLTSTAEVKPAYANLAGVTATEVEGVYDSMAAALYYYNNGGTAGELTAAYEALNPLYTALNAKKDNLFNGVYNIEYKGEPIFVAYTNAAVESMSNDVAGYKLFDMTLDGTDAKHQTLQNDAIAAKVAADALFTIVPNSELTGYTISAQGLYMHSTRNAGWAPQLLSGDEAQAGVYLFEETEANIYKLKSNRNDIQYVNDWGPIFGNDKSNKPDLSTFTLTQVTEYTLNVPASGFTTLCLPFNVVLPAGVTAYDLTAENITEVNSYPVYEFATVATEGQTLAKNTPVIIEAAAGDHTFTITMNDEGAKAATEGSVLRSGLVKTTVAAGNKYTFDGENFNIIAASTEIAANQCWMELNESLGEEVIYKEAPSTVVRLTTDEANPVLYKIIINRDFNTPNATVLKYNESTGVVNVVADVVNSSWQAWYFMEGDNGGILIKPYNGDGKVLGADDNNDGGTKVWAVDKDSKAIDEWTIEQNGEWYNILGNGKCFSNHGGSNSGTMGFYNDKNDGGSKFKFVPATFENNNPRYYQLVDVKEVMPVVYTGTSVGLFTGDTYSTALDNATALIEAGNTSASDECYVAYKAMRTQHDECYNAPDPNKVYYIVSTASNDYCRGKYVHTYCSPQSSHNNYDQKRLVYHNIDDIANKSLAAFQFEETGTVGIYKMKNLHTGLYVKSFEKNAELMGDAASAQHVRIYGIANDQVALKIGNNSPMHAQQDLSVIVDWNAEPNNASTWTINEVTNLDEIYKLTVPADGIATLNLAFNVQLPEGVTAYDFVEGDIAQAEGSDRYEFNLTQVAAAGDVLAKNTPVIIKAAAGEYNLTAVMSDENVVNGTAGSVLRGNYWQTTVGAGDATNGYNYLPNEVEFGELVFNRVTADDTPVDANTVWMVLADNTMGDKIYGTSNVELNYPEVGGVYRIKSFIEKTTAEYQNNYLYLNNSLDIASATTANESNALWVCTSADGNSFTFVSALGTAAFGWKGIDEDATVYTITAGVAEGAFTLYNGNEPLALSVDNAGNTAFVQAAAKVQAEGYSTDWFFEAVDNAEVVFEKSISGTLKWATMYLPYDVTIPDGVKAYYATIDEDLSDKTITLTEVERVIPKNTAVLLYRETATETETYEFTLADGETAKVVSLNENLFKGKILKTAISATTDKVYLLMNAGKGEAFYWVADEYNANLGFQLGGGYVKCDANKCYFTLPKGASSSSSYSFRFDGTTGIEEIEDVDNVESGDIYDLQGRKVTKPVKGGIYIKNGVKVIM